MNLFGTRLSKRAVVSMFPLYMCAAGECGDFEFKWSAALHTEGQWNMSGGATGWANLLEIGADMELWDDGGLEVAAISSYCAATPVADDVQGYSNLDAGEDKAFRLVKAGVGHTFDDRLYLFAGLRSMDEDYFSTPVTSFFTGSSYGNFPVLSMEYSQPTFPMSALALHLEYSPDDKWKFKESLYNGIASDALGRQFRFCPASDGVLNIGSVSYLPDGGDEEASVYELGYMLDSGGDRAGVRSSYWANVEQLVATVGDMRLSVLAQGGWHPGGSVECRGYVAGAVLATGVSEMDLSMGLSANRVFCPLGDDETDVELSVICPVWKYLSLQPAIHCIVANGNCDVVGLLRVTFEIGN